jgi:hypothetical protein
MEEITMRRHPLDPVSLIAGLLFAALSITLLTGRVTAGTRHLTLVWALGAVILGLGLLASGRRSHEPTMESGSQTEHGTAGEIGED